MPDRYVCSDAAGDRGEPMFATGSQVRAWLLIEVRGAWGQDAIHESALGEHVPAHWKDALRRRGVRAVCIRSHLRDDDTAGVRLFTCGAPRPGEGPAQLWRRDLGSLAEVARAVEASGLGDGDWEVVDERLLLVCTNGRHDQCCANLGRPLIRTLRESAWAAELWECSHIGGDRFAANLVVLPDSLYFGRVDPVAAPHLLGMLDEHRIDLEHFRGRTAYTLAEQAVEHFVRAELGVDAADGVIVGPRSDDDVFPVVADGGHLDVRIRRHMVSVAEPLTCRGRPDQLVPAFTLVSIERSPA
jgi:hypothetical protein